MISKEILDLFENVVKDSDLVNRMTFAIGIRDYVLSLEAKIAELSDLRNNSVLISQEDVDFLQLQNQQYADAVSNLEERLNEQFKLNKLLNNTLQKENNTQAWDCNLSYQGGEEVLYCGKVCRAKNGINRIPS